jgi:hypothetical protein
VTPLEVVRDRSHPQLGDTQALFDLGPGKWTTEPHVNGDDRYLVLVEGKTAPRTPPLSEVRSRVELDYVSRKRQELSNRLFADLMSRYDVKIVAENVTKSSDSSLDAKGQEKSP